MRAVRVEVVGPEKKPTALPEMRTALLATRAAKSMRGNDKNDFAATFFVLSPKGDESEHSESELYYPGELSERKERNSTLLTNEEVHNFL